MRHRILDVINLSLKNDKVEGIVEVDECFIKESFKGNHSKSTTFVMPRNPRKRGKGKNDKKKRGISKEQICIETAIDRKGNILMGAVCNGRITTNQIVNFFDNKICEDATFCVDSHKSYIGIKDKLNIELKQVPRGKSMIDSVYHLQHINALHSSFKRWLMTFNGVSKGGNIDGSDYIQQPYTFTNGNESLNITRSNLNNEEQISPLYTLNDKKGETNLSILMPDVEDGEISYMYTANRDNPKDHKVILEKLGNNKRGWSDVYIKVIDNVCSTNDMNIEDIKNLLGVKYSINEYSYDEKSSLNLNIVEYIFETDDEMFMVQYVKEKDKIFKVFYNK